MLRSVVLRTLASLLLSCGGAASLPATSDFERAVAARGTHSGNPASPLDLRVTPVQGSRPGDPWARVRVSVITNATAPLTVSTAGSVHRSVHRRREERLLLFSSSARRVLLHGVVAPRSVHRRREERLLLFSSSARCVLLHRVVAPRFHRSVILPGLRRYGKPKMAWLHRFDRRILPVISC